MVVDKSYDSLDYSFKRCAVLLVVLVFITSITLMIKSKLFQTTFEKEMPKDIWRARQTLVRLVCSRYFLLC